MADIADILERAADLIEPEGAWTTEADARDAVGMETGIFDGDASCFCMAGAIWHVAEPGDRWRAMEFVREHLGVEEVMDFNDEEGRTQAEVVTALREAAAKAREASNG